MIDSCFESIIKEKHEGFTIVTIQETLQKKRNEILNLAESYGARRIRVFGSVARNDADAESDVDFLVDMEPGRSLFDLGGLLMDLEELLGRKVDVVTEKGLNGRMREAALRESILL